jgi:hypothetical protein
MPSKYRDTEWWEAAWAAFGNECAYCGGLSRFSHVARQEEYSSEEWKHSFRSFDHFFPTALGGADVPANLIPSCLGCNAEKGRRKPALWYRTSSFYSKDRWRAIITYIQRTYRYTNQRVTDPRLRKLGTPAWGVVSEARIKKAAKAA